MAFTVTRSGYFFLPQNFWGWQKLRDVDRKEILLLELIFIPILKSVGGVTISHKMAPDKDAST